MGGNKYDVLI